MELKLINGVRQHQIRIILIEPFGIETRCRNRQQHQSAHILIEPFGIETYQGGIGIDLKDEF